MDILIVEDEQTLGPAVQRGLIDAGHNCQWAKDGKRGLEEAMTQKYDAVVLDVMLPELTGNEVLKQLRRRRADAGDRTHRQGIGGRSRGRFAQRRRRLPREAVRHGRIAGGSTRSAGEPTSAPRPK